MSTWIVIGVGGAVGAMARHGVNVVVHHHWPLMRFPLGTVVVNLVGCFVIGALAGLIASGTLTMRLPWRELVFVGVIGGFTTFSTFGLDTITLLRTSDYGPAIGNVALQVVGGLAGTYLGLVFGEAVGGR